MRNYESRGGHVRCAVQCDDRQATHVHLFASVSLVHNYTALRAQRAHRRLKILRMHSNISVSA